ncbi:MAG TPA: carbohydrate ABC transporter permease [Conexibacter sp.]|jgi:multiple sugar transport system permease protein
MVRRIDSGKLIATAFLVAFALYFLLPVVWVLIAATKNTSDLFGSFGLWFSHPDPIGNINHLFSAQGAIFPRWMLNSLIYSGVGALVATVLAAAAGYGLAKFPFRGRELVFSVVLGGVLVPTTVVSLPLYLLFSDIGLTNTYWAVLLPSIVSPFGVYLCRIYASESVPDELLEAARLDGAGELRIFFSVVARTMTPALVTVFLFQFIAIWNNYFLPLVMLSNQKLFPITLGLTQWNSQTYRDPGYYELVITGAAVSVILLCGAMVVLQRFWRGGLTAGSVKG